MTKMNVIKIQVGDGRFFENRSFGHTLAADYPIS